MTNLDSAAWHALAKEQVFPSQAFIDGRFVDALSGATFATVSPSDGRRLADVAQCDSADVDRAVVSARRAFEDGRWALASPAHRKSVLVKLARLMESDAQELALLECLDVGKPIRDALGVDIPASVKTVAWYGEAIDKLYGEIAPTGPGAMGLISREPVGVVGAVVPWNFPLLMAVWKVAPALAAGNSVILKPAEQSPLTALKLAELAAIAGVPDGVLNVVPGFGETAGAAIGMHRDIDAVAFTGSSEVGKLFLQYAGRSNLKQVSVECGGKSANIVMADCPDLEAAARNAAFAVFFNQGEVCSAGSRLLVDRRIEAEFIPRVVAVARELVPGDPLDPQTALGALISEQHLHRVLGFIRQGEKEGAHRVLGGRQVREESGGFYVEPTIYNGVDPASVLAQEEIFGPVLTCIPFETEDEAVRIANGTRYGLAAAVWTGSLTVAHRMSRALRAGTVWVNNYDESDITVPFGGYGESGHGRDKSLHALSKFTQLKTTWISLR